MFCFVNGTDRTSTSSASHATWAIAGAFALSVSIARHAPVNPAPETTLNSGSSTVVAAAVRPPTANAPLPELLSRTGLYASGSTSEVAGENLPYAPQYPLWSDGALKRRWIALPAGTQIDASQPEEWQFPVGTRFWKEFSFAGQRVETRYIERLSDGAYRYASYVWDRALGDAQLAPESGVLGVSEIAPGVRHDVPSRSDCRVCHEGRATPVLGLRALQLSADRDPLAPHAEPLPPGALDLDALLQRGLLANFPQAWREHAPRIQAPSATARAAAGYLFGNCAHCHNANGPLAKLGLMLDSSITAQGYQSMLVSVAGRPSHYRLPGAESSLRIAPGNPAASAVWFRMQSRFPAAQMPPLGTQLVDREAVRLLDRFIQQQ